MAMFYYRVWRHFTEYGKNCSKQCKIQICQYIKDPFLFGKPNVVCRLSDVVMLFAPMVLVFNVSKFLRFAVSSDGIMLCTPAVR